MLRTGHWLAATAGSRASCDPSLPRLVVAPRHVSDQAESFLGGGSFLELCISYRGSICAKRSRQAPIAFEPCFPKKETHSTRSFLKQQSYLKTVQRTEKDLCAIGSSIRSTSCGIDRRGPFHSIQVRIRCVRQLWTRNTIIVSVKSSNISIVW